jgi:hypothetical protein
MNKATLGKPRAQSGGQLSVQADKRAFMVREHELNEVLGLLVVRCDDRSDDQSATERPHPRKCLDLSPFLDNRKLGQPMKNAHELAAINARGGAIKCGYSLMLIIPCPEHVSRSFSLKGFPLMLDDFTHRDETEFFIER